MKHYKYLLEALDKHQTSAVDYWKDMHGTDASKALSDHVMKGEDTIHLPLKSKEDHVGEIPSDVHEHLRSNGFDIPSFHEYRAGYATDKHGRMVSIGKALTKSKAPPELKNKFDNDPARQTKQSDLHVAITRDPYHVAGMSTDRGWTSCMHMYDGCNAQHIEQDLRHGTHTAYLIHKDDKNIENPIARINLKPHVNYEHDHTILRPEGTTYGTGNDQFHSTVKEWAEQHFPMKHDGNYQPHGDVYEETGVWYNKNASHIPYQFRHLTNPKNHDGRSIFTDGELNVSANDLIEHAPKHVSYHILNSINSSNDSDETKNHQRMALANLTKHHDVMNSSMHGLSPADKHHMLTGKYQYQDSKFASQMLSHASKFKVDPEHTGDAIDHALKNEGSSLDIKAGNDEQATKILNKVGAKDYLSLRSGKESNEFINKLARDPELKPNHLIDIAHLLDADTIHHLIDKHGGKISDGFLHNEMSTNSNYDQSHADRISSLFDSKSRKYQYHALKSIPDDAMKNYPGLAEYALHNVKNRDILHKAVDHINEHGTSTAVPIKAIKAAGDFVGDKKIADFITHSPHVHKNAISYLDSANANRLHIHALKSDNLTAEQKYPHLKAIMDTETPRSYQFAAMDVLKGTDMEDQAKAGFRKVKNHDQGMQ